MLSRLQNATLQQDGRVEEGLWCIVVDVDLGRSFEVETLSVYANANKSYFLCGFCSCWCCFNQQNGELAENRVVVVVAVLRRNWPRKKYLGYSIVRHRTQTHIHTHPLCDYCCCCVVKVCWICWFCVCMGIHFIYLTQKNGFVFVVIFMFYISLCCI